MKYTLTALITILVATQVFAQKSKMSYSDSIAQKINQFAIVDLKYDVTKLPDYERMIVHHLVNAAYFADSIFWLQTYGAKNALLSSLEDDNLKKFVKINYGPWERLNNNQPFVKGISAKPAGANFYPKDISKKEFEELKDTQKYSPYTIIVRNAEGKLVVKPYPEVYQEFIQMMSMELQMASGFIGENDTSFSSYLLKRSESLLSNNYEESDIAWLNSKNNLIDIIIGPIENYEDQLFGIKTAYEAYIVVKDTAWSRKLQKYVKLLPKLQNGLPVEDKYKSTLPGLKSEIGAYDVLFYAGDCNSGSKTIAVNLPNDENVQAMYGTRRLQFKNAMQAKFDKILMPMADVLIDEKQRGYINFESFFSNTMFHEVAHGLGIKNTIDSGFSVSSVLQEYHSSLEEGKADVLGLYMITELLSTKEITEGTLENYYTTFVASILRSIRFGSASAHGVANIIRFNYFIEQGAISRNTNGTYTIDYFKMKKAVYALSSIILKIQGDGSKENAQKLIDTYGKITPQLQSDLNKLEKLNIPVDIIFNQGGSNIGIPEPRRR